MAHSAPHGTCGLNTVAIPYQRGSCNFFIHISSFKELP
jgi:hypothetical protein